MKKWEILTKTRIKNQESGIRNLIKILLDNRKIKTKKEIEEFLNPKLKSVNVQNVGIDKKELEKSVERIKEAIKNSEQIIVYGDYDVDGITGSAILWETLNSAGAKVLPYIPHRIDEGYGLSVKGIENLLEKIKDVKLIITVDNGIVANGAVEYANGQGIDVIITDHHVVAKKLPEAFSIVHTTKLCGAGVAYMLTLALRSLRQFENSSNASTPAGSSQSSVALGARSRGDSSEEFSHAKAPRASDPHLELVALATIADLVPLKGASRTLTKFGLERLRETERIGLLELFKKAGLDKTLIGTYEVGHIIAPRINAMGRLESAMDSLRLICTQNQKRAEELALKLNNTNITRQGVTEQAVLHALSNLKVGKVNGRLIFVADESYQQGVIGLVAGKLVEQYYLPSIVVSKGDIYSKASARSISGFNIIEFIRTASDLLVDAGGHPMAAGFTIETAKIELVKKKFEELALKQVSKKLLNQTLRIDCELPLNLVSNSLYDAIQKLAPFGMGNPTPVFVSKGEIEDLRLVGQDAKHLKLKIKDQKSNSSLEGIAFNMGERASEFKIGDKVSLAYTIDQDLWNGNKKLQLKIKDIKLSN